MTAPSLSFSQQMLRRRPVAARRSHTVPQTT